MAPPLQFYVAGGGDTLAALVGRFSQLLVDLPELAEIEINPLTVGPSGAVAVDARARLGR